MLEKTARVLKTMAIIEVMLIINIICAWGIIRLLDNLFPTLGW